MTECIVCYNDILSPITRDTTCDCKINVCQECFEKNNCKCVICERNDIEVSDGGNVVFYSEEDSFTNNPNLCDGLETIDLLGPSPIERLSFRTNMPLILPVSSMIVRALPNCFRDDTHSDSVLIYFSVNNTSPEYSYILQPSRELECTGITNAVIPCNSTVDFVMGINLHTHLYFVSDVGSLAIDVSEYTVFDRDDWDNYYTEEPVIPGWLLGSSYKESLTACELFRGVTLTGALLFNELTITRNPMRELHLELPDIYNITNFFDLQEFSFGHEMYIIFEIKNSNTYNDIVVEMDDDDELYINKAHNCIVAKNTTESFTIHLTNYDEDCGYTLYNTIDIIDYVNMDHFIVIGSFPNKK